MITRLAWVVATVLVFTFGSAAVALADELADRMDHGVGVVYSGEQSVICDQPDGRHAEVFKVGQNDQGIVVTVDPSGTTRSSRAMLGSADLGPGYTVRVGNPDVVLGRPVEVIEVVDAGTLRVRLAFDVESSVLLMSEIFNGDGSTYCTTRLVDFVLGTPGPADGIDATDESPVDGAVPTGNVDPALPVELAGFTRLQVTLGSQPDVSSGFYGDGVFTFQLTNSSRPISVPELDRQPRVTIDGHEYQRIFELGRAVYAWNSDLGGYVLVGELPTDVQARVLSELPDPKSRGFFERLWNDLFG